MMPSSKPIFMVNAPRSGSTLLRLILDAHPKLAVPPPTWLYEMIYPFLYSYGDLTIKANYRALAEDILESPVIKNWKMDLSADQMVEAATEQTFAGLYDALHRIYSEKHGKIRWGEKSPRDSYWIDEIRNDFSDAQFVHIVRDGRDMAIDIATSAAMAPSNPFSGVHIWLDYNRAVLEAASRLNRKNYYRMRYEDLCADPENELKKLCAYLCEDFDPGMLAHYQTPSAKAWSSIPNHQKAGRPITKEYCGMYLKRLRPKDRAFLNYVIHDMLTEFGYPVEDAPQAISQRLAWQLLECDSITAPRVIPYRQWHEKRRKERKDKGVWQNQDLDSFLRSLD